MPSAGKLSIVGIGPGDLSQITRAAAQAISNAHFVVGYRPYLELIGDLIPGKQVVESGMGQEVERVKTAVELAADAPVALISSGDPNVYGMGGLGMEMAGGKAEVIPGVTSFAAAACRAGLTFSRGVAALSLSDLLTPWAEILGRVRAAADLDLPLALYNPRSRKRDWQLVRVLEELQEAGKGGRQMLAARNVYRSAEEMLWTSVDELLAEEDLRSRVDMFTLLIVGGKRRPSDVHFGCPGLPVIGIGPGSPDHLTALAEERIRTSTHLLGPARYTRLIEGLQTGQVIAADGPCPERLTRRIEQALAALRQGGQPALLVGGDPSIFSSAGRIMDLTSGKARVEMMPGVSAFSMMAARAGAPLANDFAVISGPGHEFQKLLDSGFAVFFYNLPADSIREVLAGLPEKQPCALARDLTRPGEMLHAGWAADISIPPGEEASRCTLLVASPGSVLLGDKIVASRGYQKKYRF
ncbi:MAG: precorrin-3B C17-methyltransferase [Methanosaeta sp. PtaB.Bin039]|nr:MAG: precorrin-3B C17-methyltransferase [Methanosaeta sp. PtaB.Bin039]